MTAPASDSPGTKREKNPAIWTYSFGERPNTVAAFERPERGNTVWIKYTDPAKPSRDVNGKRLDRRSSDALDVPRVRDDKGKLDAKLVAAAKRAVQRAYANLSNGKPAVPPPAPARPLHESVFGGFLMALAPLTGKYPDTKALRYREMCGIRDLLFGAAPLIEEDPHEPDDVAGERERNPKSRLVPRRPLSTKPLLSPDLTWAEWTPSAARALARRLAELHIETGRGGVRRAEVIVDAVYSVAAWLREEGHLEPTVAKPADKWRRKLKDEWATITNSVVKVERPRHSEAEMRLIFTAIDPDFSEPRIDLARALGHHHFHRATRRDLDLGAGEHGELLVPPMGKRREPKVVPITEEQRSALDAVMGGGYLSECERAFAKGELSDYPLFPAGVLAEGRAPAGNAQTSLKQPFVDARIRLVVDVGAECRLGQVMRCRRSNLTLPELPLDALDLMSSGTLGHIVVPGRPPRKSGETVYLTPEMYRDFRYALTDGYLSEMEALYQSGLLRDFLLFPAGRLVAGKAKPDPDATPMHRATALVLFHELEELAGVKPKRRRGWYGLRRIATDVARRYTSDAKVLNAQGGWKDSRTREDIYQDPDNEEVKHEAAQVRRAARLGLPVPAQPPTTGTP